MLPNTACTWQVGFSPSKGVDSALEHFPSKVASIRLELTPHQLACGMMCLEVASPELAGMDR